MTGVLDWNQLSRSLPCYSRITLTNQMKNQLIWSWCHNRSPWPRAFDLHLTLTPWNFSNLKPCPSTICGGGHRACTTSPALCIVTWLAQSGGQILYFVKILLNFALADFESWCFCPCVSSLSQILYGIVPSFLKTSPRPVYFAIQF